MEKIIYELGDYSKGFEDGTIAFYKSFESAKMGLIDILKESAESYENELDRCENTEYAKELDGFIAELKEKIKNVEKATPTHFYTCSQFYISKDILN